MNNLPKLVASDIGGTLIWRNSQIPEYTAKVFDKLINLNIPVVLITGYNYTTTMNYTSNLNKNIILMPQNGSMYVKDRKKIREYWLPHGKVKTIYNFFMGNNLPIFVYKGRGEENINYFIGPKDHNVSNSFQRIDNLVDFSNITGISTCISNEIVENIKIGLREIIDSQFQLVYVKEKDQSWLEILPIKVRKDLALKRLSEELSIPLTDIIYFGDNFNDLEALRIVGYPVVVDNAVPDLKAEFKTIVKSVSEEGVALYLNELFNLNL
jgi:Cof subfamily protein (haloacid dehalogenase superfamily)